MDETFVIDILKEEFHVLRFQKYSNEQHTNACFTVEPENKGKLNFLDVSLAKNSDANIRIKYHNKKDSDIF